MKLKPKKSNPPIPKFIYTLSPDVKPIHEQNSNPNLKTKSTEVIKTPKSNPFRWISGFFFNYSSNLPTLMQYTTRTEPRSKETKNSNTSPRRPPKKKPIQKEGNVIDGGEIVNVENG